MNFIKFPVQSTNIFPMANTTNGGQLVTEFNLKSRESVSTPESVEYTIGPSYTHSEKDFGVQLLGADDDYFGNSSGVSTVIEILPGRAVVNGHYFESLVPIVLDLTAINAELHTASEPLLGGDLAIGLKAMYSTEQNISGSILTEYTDPQTGVDYCAGVQIVLLPVEDFHLPTTKFIFNDEEINCGLAENQQYVTADLLLATFSLVNGSVSNLKNNYPGKCEMFPAVRIGHVDELLSSAYVKKTGLNPKRLYAFAGKGTNPATGLDTWCDATDSLMVWDDSVPQYTDTEPTIQKATFSTNSSGVVSLIVPHKQIDSSYNSVGYDMESSSGNQQFFKPVKLDIPVADFTTGTPGTVDANYTQHVKNVISKIDNIYHLAAGKQRAYIQTLDDRSKLPTITANWEVGDYVLVAHDNTVISEVNDNAALGAPATIYVVLPGAVREIGNFENFLPPGTELDRIYLNQDSGYENPWEENNWWNLTGSNYHGKVDSDYFTMMWSEVDIDTNQTVVHPFYYRVTATDGNVAYSDPIILTGQLPFAEEAVVGGFLNVSSSDLDQGYVWLDSEGHLRLLDYALLRSGMLAYQLGEDFTVPAGVTIDQVQAYLDEYVNQRIVFPKTGTSPTDANVITVTLTLTEDLTGTINLYDLESRFGTAVRLSILGPSTSDVIINVINCEKIMIEPAFECRAKINVYRSCVFYNSGVFARFNEISGLSIWYEAINGFTEDIVVDGMTVRAVNMDTTNDDVDTTSVEFWEADEQPNDNHLMVGTQSITFAPDGRIIGMSVLVRNNSTSNVSVGKTIYHTSFELPQGPALYIPLNRLVQPINVTGQFVSAYPSELPEGYVVQDTKFSLATPYYDSNQNLLGAGDIAFLIDSSVVEVADPTSIDEWDPGTFHSFTGTTQV